MPPIDFRNINPLTLSKGTNGAYTKDPNQPFIKTNFKKTKTDYEWVYTDEPHTSRRKAILKEHPEILRLCGPEIKTFYIVLFVVISQLWIASWIGNSSWLTWFLVMYIYGATVNHSMQLANHEISHNLVFDNLWGNFALGIIANIPTGVPSSVTFRYYHMDHHIYQGVDVIDTDVPCAWELRTFTTTIMKLIWMTCQSLAYALRPMYVNPKPITKWQVFNAVIIFIIDYFIYLSFGLWGLLYLIIGSLVGIGLHPAAGHFIAEHYVFVQGFETYSYYGILNYVNFNVGMHNEHHDFPKIPWSRLGKVRQIAPEWYNHLPRHDSYVKVIWKFITDPGIGPWSRIKRKTCSRWKKNKTVHHVTVD